MTLSSFFVCFSRQSSDFYDESMATPETKKTTSKISTKDSAKIEKDMAILGLKTLINSGGELSTSRASHPS